MRKRQDMRKRKAEEEEEEIVKNEDGGMEEEGVNECCTVCLEQCPLQS